MPSDCRIETRANIARLLAHVPTTITDGIIYVGTAGNGDMEEESEWIAEREFETLDISPIYTPDIVADIRSTGLPANSYNLIVISQTIEHIFEKEAAIAECARLLAPDGWLLIDCPWMYPLHEEAEFGDFWRISAAAMQRLLRIAGLTVVDAIQGTFVTSVIARKPGPAAQSIDIARQDADSSWNRLSPWGQLSARRVVAYANLIRPFLAMDDRCADFGGNDGFVAETFFRATGVPMLVVDGLQSRLDVAASHGLATLRAELESIPLESGSIDWGYCSHTLEHVTNLGATIAELARIVRRGLFVVVPLERDGIWQQNPAHLRGNDDPVWWAAQLQAAGFETSHWHDDLNPNDIIIFATKPDINAAPTEETP